MGIRLFLLCFFCFVCVGVCVSCSNWSFTFCCVSRNDCHYLCVGGGGSVVVERFVLALISSCAFELSGCVVRLGLFASGLRFGGVFCCLIELCMRRGIFVGLALAGFSIAIYYMRRIAGCWRLKC